MNLRNEEININLWFFPGNLPLQPISIEEKKWSNYLVNSRRHEFQYSRGYIRFALSTIFKKDPLSIPLFAKPNKPPLLKKGLGFLSISHCKDALFIGWSNSKIGVDIESKNRTLNTNMLSNYLLSQDEKIFIQDTCEKAKARKFLSIWVLKEALVKYNKGSIIRDFKSWKINHKENIATKNDSQDILSINQLNYKNFLMGVAYDLKFQRKLEISHIY